MSEDSSEGMCLVGGWVDGKRAVGWGDEEEGGGFLLGVVGWWEYEVG